MANAMTRHTARINQDGQKEFTTFRAWHPVNGYRSFQTLEEAHEWTSTRWGDVARIDKIVTTIVWMNPNYS